MNINIEPWTRSLVERGAALGGKGGGRGDKPFSPHLPSYVAW